MKTELVAALQCATTTIVGHRALPRPVMQHYQQETAALTLICFLTQNFLGHSAITIGKTACNQRHEGHRGHLVRPKYPTDELGQDYCESEKTS